MPLTAFRIQRLKGKATRGRPEGYHYSYEVLVDETPSYRCHTNLWCIKPTDFTPLSDTSQPGFRLQPSRRVLPWSWVVDDLGSGQRVGMLTRGGPGSTAWRIRDAAGQEIGRFKGRYRPRFLLFRLIDLVFGVPFPEDYTIDNGHEVIADMKHETRPGEPEQAQGKGLRGILARAMTDTDWVVRERAPGDGSFDARLLVAAAILIIGVSRASGSQ